MSYVADEDVYRLFEKHNYVLSFIHCHGICVYIVFFAVNSSINAAGDHLAGGSFMEKGLNQRLFPIFCGVVVRCSRVEPRVPGSSPIDLFFSFFLFFSVFFVVVFYHDI